MALSLRLALISTLVPPGARVCDIGTDHGYLPIELIKRGDIKSVIATDIRKMPLANADKNIKATGVGGITLRLCDGLEGQYWHALPFPPPRPLRCLLCSPPPRPNF